MRNTNSSKVVEKTLKFFAKNSANSTSSGTLFQPIVPAKLKSNKANGK
ncbi:MAG: cyclic lactone autoinducer peptide [Clostridia bacterium]|jgi:cyclic lactone autoinducer peptide|nr:cyclic lactone autoinducer peptide [Clostridia bacterium]